MIDNVDKWDVDAISRFDSMMLFSASIFLVGHYSLIGLLYAEYPTSTPNPIPGARLVHSRTAIGPCKGLLPTCNACSLAGRTLVLGKDVLGCEDDKQPN